MPRKKDDKIRQAIRDAGVDDVVDVGLGGTSLPRIARRAGLSQGTIYLYFDNKDALLQDVYMEIKEAAHAQLMAATKGATTSKERIQSIWNALIDFMIENPKDFAFRENVAAALALTQDRQASLKAMEQELLSILENAVADQTLKPAPIDSIVAVLVAPARHLARAANTSATPLSARSRDETFHLIWAGISLID